jgi:hypothetical protein
MFYHLKLNLNQVEDAIGCLGITKKSLLVGMNIAYSSEHRSEEGEATVHKHFMRTEYVSNMLNRAAYKAKRSEDNYAEFYIIYMDMDVLSSVISSEIELHKNYINSLMDGSYRNEAYDDVNKTIYNLTSLLDSILSSSEVEVPNEEIFDL